MRRELIKFLGERLLCEIAKDLTSSRRLGEEEYFNGTVGIRIGSSALRTFFVAALVSESNDTFRINFAWSESGDYPFAPYNDIRASLSDFIGFPNSEFQLAVLDPLVIPWSWDLDRAHADWHSEMTRLQRGLQRGDPMLSEAFGRHLQKMPKRCSLGVAKKAASLAAVEIAGYVNRYGRQLMSGAGVESRAPLC